MNNYPPGVYGNEPEIAGYDDDDGYKVDMAGFLAEVAYEQADDYAREALHVHCEACGRDVHVAYAVYEPYAQCWICDECLEPTGESEE